MAFDRFDTMKCLFLFLLLLGSISLGRAQTLGTMGRTTPAPAVRIDDLGWLAGNWRGTLENGASFEAHYTSPEGGAIVSASKEVKHGRIVAFELELFFEQDGRVIYRPFPNGRRSEHDFPLVSYEAGSGGARAVFENKEHDFPQTFVFALASPEQLIITLAGPAKDGSTRRLQFDLRRVP